MKKLVQVLMLLIIVISFCYSALHLLVLKNGTKLIDAGPIGDIIGGLSGPIINLVSVALIFYSFREQFEANELQRVALKEEINRSNTLKELDQILDLLKDVKEGISELTISITHIEQYTGDETIVRYTGDETIYHIDKIETERAFGKYVTELSKILRLLEFICEKTESYKFERRDEQVIFEKIDLIYDEHFSKEVEKIKANPYPDNLDIELRLRFIETYSRKVTKHYKSFFARESDRIEKEGKVKIDKAQKVYDRFKLKRLFWRHGVSFLKLILILIFCYFSLLLIIRFFKFCLSTFN